jgi:ABC-2 type transport system permease protein
MSGWFQTVAELNPLSWMINAAREMVIDEFTLAAALRSLAVASALLVLAVFMAVRQLQRRLAVAS